MEFVSGEVPRLLLVNTSLGHLERHLFPILLLHYTLACGPHVCCPSISTQESKEAEVPTSGSEAHQWHFLHSVCENLVIWLYPVAVESGKFNLVGQLCP